VLKVLISIVGLCLSSLLGGLAYAETHPLIDLRGFWIIDEARPLSFEDNVGELFRRPGAKIQISRGSHRTRLCISMVMVMLR
jgi:hypothetical protein